MENFKRGEIIEVSNDSNNWNRKVYFCTDHNNNKYVCEDDMMGRYYYSWEYARKIEEKPKDLKCGQIIIVLEKTGDYRLAYFYRYINYLNNTIVYYYDNVKNLLSTNKWKLPTSDQIYTKPNSY